MTNINLEPFVELFHNMINKSAPKQSTLAKKGIFILYSIPLLHFNLMDY